MPASPRDDVRTRVIALCRSEDRGHETKCLIWYGTDRDRGGYGRVKRDGKYVQVHWVLAGDPPKGMEKDHLCHQRDCVRPSHLADATKSQNTANRQVTSHKRLTIEQRLQVVMMLDSGVERAIIVEATGISRRTVNRIYEVWKSDERHSGLPRQSEQ
jgi:hypothetical protein